MPCQVTERYSARDRPRRVAESELLAIVLSVQVVGHRSPGSGDLTVGRNISKSITRQSRLSARQPVSRKEIVSAIKEPQ